MDKRLNRLEYRLGRGIIPTLQLTAGNILRSKFFDGFILTMVVLNSITLGIQAELRTNMTNGTMEYRNEVLNTYLDYFDQLCLMTFVMEILIKWMDNFMEFWLSGWNIFDFVVTMLSVAPEVMRLFAEEEKMLAKKGITSMHSYLKVR